MKIGDVVLCRWHGNEVAGYPVKGQMVVCDMRHADGEDMVRVQYEFVDDSRPGMLRHYWFVADELIPAT